MTMWKVLILTSCLIWCPGLVLGSDIDCLDVSAATLPSRCCHPGRSLFNQTMLRSCAESINDDDHEKVLKTLKCYLTDNGMIINDRIDLQTTYRHFLQNYPATAADLSFCDHHGMLRFFLLNCKFYPNINLYTFIVNERDLYTAQESMSDNVIHWVICIEKRFLDCPVLLKVESKRCNALDDFVANCVGRKERIDYFVHLINTILFDD